MDRFIPYSLDLASFAFSCSQTLKTFFLEGALGPIIEFLQVPGSNGEVEKVEITIFTAFQTHFREGILILEKPHYS